ncbi:acyl-CoA dehydrogenase family protein [Aquisediminimonas profunda]|uniref:acyl-CoA dehydrogenase family protein n=1 Tax=Aquisediminimonas profunda TaxID=1550733 RepID=UPI001C62F9D4|nr:acyl-CoA dehydrogenase family protein [Aquisediminimonas profunda]
MNFDLSEEQTLFKATVERFSAKMDVPARQRLRKSDGAYDRERWRELAGFGLIALCADEDDGGIGGSSMDLAIVAESLGHGLAPDPWIENAVLPLRLLTAAGATAGIAPLIDGDRIVAAALAERRGRYNLQPQTTKVTVHGGRQTLRGEKTFVLGGAIADDFLVSATRDGTLVLCLVSGDSTGVDRHIYRLVDGSLACELRLNDVELSADAVFVLEQNALTGIVADVRLIAAGELLGLAQRLFDDTLDYVKQREQFGVSIGTFQAIQHRLVDCYAQLEQARSMLYRAAMQDRSDGTSWHRSAAGAKAFIGEQAGFIAREAVQLHGGMGITDELSIGHGLKRVMLLNAFLGDSDTTLTDYAEAA